MPGRPDQSRQADLFLARAERDAAASAPLAARIRPRTLEEFVGQDHLLAPGHVLRRAIEQDRVPSMIFWGPPGTGKTTLARLIAGTTGAAFVGLSAVAAGVADLRRVAEEARQRRALENRGTILFIDEIHRFNRAQQDVVLPHVEEGTFTLIGATTENPSFEVNAALLSRCRVYTLHPLTPEQIGQIVDRALQDSDRGLGRRGLQLSPEARDRLLLYANGDARAALNALELAADLATTTGSSGVITPELLAEAVQRRSLAYDRSGEAHYDTISAFIKSLRGSDPDAAIYWLARMIESGEDPLFIVRRMVILAAEDVGLADPQALVVATACQQAVHFVGLPEGFLPMAETALYLALAPKSNSALTAYTRALKDVRETLSDPVPLHLRNAPTALMKELGYGTGYRYAHDFPDRRVEQQYLPDNLVGRRYYQPGSLGFEATRAQDNA